jgi:hypothetical protein
MLQQDELVLAIFEAMKHAEATPHQRKGAIIRAGMIAQAYNDTGELIEKVFGSSSRQGLNDKKNLDTLSS